MVQYSMTGPMSSTYIETHFGLFSDGVLWHVGCTNLLCDSSRLTILNICPPQLSQDTNTIHSMTTY